MTLTTLPDFQRRFGKVVLRRRLEAKLGQEDFANKAGLHRNHLSLLEQGKHLPSIPMVHKLAQAFGISMSELVAEAESELADQGEPPALPRGRPKKERPTETVKEGKSEEADQDEPSPKRPPKKKRVINPRPRKK